MAIWGMGVMLGPIMGPTLGGWLTEYYQLALGVLRQPAVRHRHRARPMRLHGRDPTQRDDCPSTGSASSRSALGIGSLQLMLDRGEQVGWFDSREIWLEAVVAGVGFYFFLAHA